MTAVPGVQLPVRGDEPAGRRARWAFWMSPVGQPRWARPVLLVIAAVVAASYAWATAGQQPEIYYAAAVRSMASSWHDFFFGAFDPAGTVSVDKLPGALWLQALSVRAFGLHLWALNLPQVIEGTLSVLVLYRVVRRLSGVPAALVATVVYAVMPATVALNRGNVSDSLLILLLLCAIDAACLAAVSGRVRPLLAAGAWVGLAFQAKMLQAWLVLPALLLVWLLVARRSVGRRVVAAVAMLAVTVLVSLSWMLVVSAVPRDDRPYVDGSSHDSVFAQVFVYNGFGRADSTTTSSAGSQSIRELTEAVTLDADSRADRSVAGPGGRAVGWLLPVAVLGLLAGLWTRRGRPRGDPQRAAALLWSVWLVVDLAAFTAVNTINAYYLAALTPPIAALTGIAVASAYRALIAETRDKVRAAALRRWARIGLPLLAAAIAGYGSWLLTPAPGAVRIAAPALAVGLCVLAVAGDHRVRLAASSAAVLVAPVLACFPLVTEHGGPFVTPFEPAAARAVTQGDVALAITQARTVMPAITVANAGATYTAAAYTSLLAAPLIYVSGAEILPIGGFRGTSPAPTLTELVNDIHTSRLRTVLVLPTSDPRVEWIQANCHQLPATATAITVYYCA